MRGVLFRLRRAPQPLVLLMGAVLIVGLAWVYVVPPWQAPDEFHHFAYTQSLVERGERPGDGPRLISTEQELAGTRSNALQSAGVASTRPSWAPAAVERWERGDAALPEAAQADGGGATGASGNPPLYYAIESVAYRAAGGDVFDRFYAMRVLSVLNLLAVVAGAWLLAGEVFGRDRLLQLLAASVAGLQPMVVFVSSSINPDSMMFGLWAIALWLGARILNRGLHAPAVLGLGVVTAAAIAVKGTSYALLPAVALVLTVAAVRHAYARGGARAGRAAIAGAIAVSLAGTALLAVSGELDRAGSEGVRDDLQATEFGSYLWQFYLPRLGFMQPFGILPDSGVYEIWLKGGWAAFGSLEVGLGGWLYPVLAALTAIALVAGVAALVRRRTPRNLWLAGFFGVLAITLLGGLHWTEYVEMQRSNGLLNQGRYLLPLIPIAGVGVAAAVTLLRAKARGAATGAVVGGLLLLQILSLGTIAERYYT